MRKLTPNEIFEIEEQLPQEPEDVFQMYVDPEPKVEHEYDTDPSQDQTVVVSLDKSKYPRLDLAKSRAAEVFELRGLKPYKFFQTARHFCWKTVRR